MAENDAPERIWAFKRADGGRSWHDERLELSDVEYLRADLAAPDAAQFEVWWKGQIARDFVQSALIELEKTTGPKLIAGTEDIAMAATAMGAARRALDKALETLDDANKFAAPADAARQARRETWNSYALKDWDIVGMNHYHVDGERRLFVAMTNGIHCIRAEGADELEVFRVLELNAAALRAEGEKGGDQSAK